MTALSITNESITELSDMSRQQRRFEARKGKREVGFTPVLRTRTRLKGLLGKTPQRFEWLPDGGYRTYHPCKGWRKVSPKRLRFFPGAHP